MVEQESLVAELISPKKLRRYMLPISRPPNKIIIKVTKPKDDVRGDILLSLEEFRNLILELRKMSDVSVENQKSSQPINIWNQGENCSNSSANNKCAICSSPLTKMKKVTHHCKIKSLCLSCNMHYINEPDIHDDKGEQVFNEMRSPHEEKKHLTNSGTSSAHRATKESKINKVRLQFKCITDFFNYYICVYKRKTNCINDSQSCKINQCNHVVRLLVPPPNLYPGDIARRVLQTVEQLFDAIISDEDILLDREKRTIVTRSSLVKRQNRWKSLKTCDNVERRLKKYCVKLKTSQKALGYLRIMGCRYIDKCRYGKDNQIRRLCLGRVINGCSRNTVGTKGVLPAGHITIPTVILRTLGESFANVQRLSCRSNAASHGAATAKTKEMFFLCENNGCRKCDGELIASHINQVSNVECFEKKSRETTYGDCNAIRYPVIDKLNIAYARMCLGGNQWTAYVPSSQFKYNGGDNDGDAFNFERFTNGLLANSSYENRLLTAPWYHAGNNGQLKMEFDSDAKLGLGLQSQHTCHLAANGSEIVGIYPCSVSSPKCCNNQISNNLSNFQENNTMMKNNITQNISFGNEKLKSFNETDCSLSEYKHKNIPKQDKNLDPYENEEKKHFYQFADDSKHFTNSFNGKPERVTTTATNTSYEKKSSTPRWRHIMKALRTHYFSYNNSFDIYKKFCAYEEHGRDQSMSNGHILSLQDYADFASPGGSLNKLIQCEAVPRLTLAHYMHSTQSLGKQIFAYNSAPVRTEIRSSLLNGLNRSDFIASCQATFDALANQKSAEMSLQGNLQYQFQYVLRPMILSPDRKIVYNPVTKKIVSFNVSSVYAINRADANDNIIVKVALDFARMVLGFDPVFQRNKKDSTEMYSEVAQFQKYMTFR